MCESAQKLISSTTLRKSLSHIRKTQKSKNDIFFWFLVYQQYIKNRHHVHMNATHWSTLSGFVQYLGKTGKAKVEKAEKGWWITYINRDPDFVRRQVCWLSKTTKKIAFFGFSSYPILEFCECVKVLKQLISFAP